MVADRATFSSTREAIDEYATVEIVTLQLVEAGG